MHTRPLFLDDRFARRPGPTPGPLAEHGFVYIRMFTEVAVVISVAINADSTSVKHQWHKIHLRSLRRMSFPQNHIALFDDLGGATRAHTVPHPID
jgi:hypothetical protein